MNPVMPYGSEEARDNEAPACALCGRGLGVRREAHHLVPRAKGGVETVALHPICHRKIHFTFSNQQLATQFHSISRLKSHPEIATFLKWVTKKPANFYKATFGPARSARGRNPRGA